MSDLEDLEDGEILDSSGDEMMDKSEEKNSAVTVTTDAAKSEGQPRCLVPPSVAPPATVSSGGRSVTAYRSLDRHVSSDSSESSNNEDDDEDSPMWRQKKAKYFRNRKEKEMAVCSSPTLPEYKGRDMANESDKPQTKKVNNVWGSVLQEQVLTRTLTQNIAVVNEGDALDFNERDVESYDFNKKYEDTRPHVEDCDAPKPLECHDPFESVITTNFGLAAGRSIIDYEDSEKPRRRGVKRKAESHSKNRHGSRIQDRLGEKVTQPKLGELAIDVNESDKDISAKIVDFLHEEKSELIERVVEHLGKEVAIRLARFTKDVEESGGMLTFDGSRRRTPGGVFLQLMKQQPEFTKKVRPLIFAEDWDRMQQRYVDKKQRKKRAQRDRRKRHGKSDPIDSGGSNSRDANDDKMDDDKHSSPEKSELNFAEELRKTKELIECKAKLEEVANDMNDLEEESTVIDIPLGDDVLD